MVGSPATGVSKAGSGRCWSGTTTHRAGHSDTPDASGSGLDESKRALLEQRVRSLARATSPFEHTPKLPSPHWVEPMLVVEVGFHQWTSAGVLRAPRYRGLRDDKAAAEVVREVPLSTVWDESNLGLRH